MNKVMIAIIFGIALISLASAEVIKIEPEVLEPFLIYSGESITRNITIKTDGNYLVYLSWGVEGNSSDMEGFYVDYESPIQVNREREVQVNLSAAYNFFPDSFTIYLSASTEIEKPAVIYRGGGSRTIYKDRNITIEKEVEKIIYVNQTIGEIEVEEPEEPIEKEKKGWLLFVIFCGAMVILIIFFIGVWAAKKHKKDEKEDAWIELKGGKKIWMKKKR